MIHRHNKGRLSCLLAAFSIDAPLHKKFANAAIATRWMKVTRKYMSSIGTVPNYIDPVSYTEKMQCRKLFDRNPAFPVFCDKLLTREYITEKGFKKLLPKLLWSGSDPKKIPFDALTPPYIIKPTHRSGAKLVVRTKDDVDKFQIYNICRKWIRRSYGRGIGEWGYQYATRRILIEELLPSEENEPYPKDYKLFVFSGRVVLIHVRSVQETQEEKPRDAFFDRGWNRKFYCRWRLKVRVEKYLGNMQKPACLDQMIDVAEKLATKFDHLRVDFYVTEGFPIVGELTVYNESGFAYWFPEDAVYKGYPPHTLNDYYGSIWQQSDILMTTKLRQMWFGMPAIFKRK